MKAHPAVLGGHISTEYAMPLNTYLLCLTLPNSDADELTVSGIILEDFSDVLSTLNPVWKHYLGFSRDGLRDEHAAPQGERFADFIDQFSAQIIKLLNDRKGWHLSPTHHNIAPKDGS